MSFFSLAANVIIWFLIILTGTSWATTKGYCLHIASSTDISQLIKLAKELNCTVKDIRVEKSGNLYTLKAGFFLSKEKALLESRKIKNSNVESCNYDNNKIVFKTCSKNEGFITLSLKDLGYPLDIVLKGTLISHTFFIPVLPSFDKGVLELKMSFSSTVPENGRVTISINDVPFKTFKISEIGYNPTLEIPIIPDRKSNFSKITLTFNFIPKEDVCQILNVKDIYIHIYNSSKLLIHRKAEYTKDILSYLMDYNSTFSIKSKNIKENAVIAYSLASLYKSFGLYNLNFSEENGKPIQTTNGKTELLADYLSLNIKDIEGIKSHTFLLKTDKFSIKSQTYPKLKNSTFYPIKLFGFKTSTQKGIGDMGFSFTIPFSKLKGKPENMLLLLRYSVQNINSKSGDRLWCSVFVNNQLIWSKELTSASSIQENLIEIPGYTLNFGNNYFYVEFSYYPGNTTCTGSVPLVRTTLFDSSAISFTKAEREFRNARELLQSLSGNVSLIMKGHPSQAFVENLFKLIGFYNSNINSFFTENKPSEKPDFYIIVAPFNEIRDKNLPMHYDNYIIVKNPLIKTDILKFKGNYDFLVFEIGQYNKSPALIVAFSSRKAEQFINRLSWEDFDRFIGNVNLIFKNEIYPLEIGKKFRVEYSSKTAIELFIKKYRLLIFIILLTILTLFIGYLWRKLT